MQSDYNKPFLTGGLKVNSSLREIVGESKAAMDTLQLVSLVAPSESTVLILGETGTGKELIARSIHAGSSRKHRLMVKVNCATLPANLIESELFGHEKGSFTGAIERRLGKFELADNGTIFLDEIGEMPLELQVKLLRALQEREIERVGGKCTIKINVRIIAATNRDLEKEVSEGRFRSDLYYRLNVFPINLQPLRNRPEDIPLLADYFLKRFSRNGSKKAPALSTRAKKDIMNYHWPGNIRELEHLIERSILLSDGVVINEICPPENRKNKINKSAERKFVIKTIEENERDHIIATLKYCQGKIGGKGGAAELLGVPPSTLASKIKRLDIRKEHL
jgi:formate hydrogenlyase transcriptional activator